MRHFFSAVALLLALILLAPMVGAQHAAPALVTPDPGECRVEPRPIETLMSFLAAPAVNEATPEVNLGTPAMFVPPISESTSADTVAGMTATATELFACYVVHSPETGEAMFIDYTIVIEEAGTM